MPLATDRRRGLAPPSPAMLALLARIRGGAELVTGERRTLLKRRMEAEVGGERVPVGAARGLIERGLVRVQSQTQDTKTWEAA